MMKVVGLILPPRLLGASAEGWGAQSEERWKCLNPIEAEILFAFGKKIVAESGAKGFALRNRFVF
jgi:hypothetical protein